MYIAPSIKEQTTALDRAWDKLALHTKRELYEILNLKTELNAIRGAHILRGYRQAIAYNRMCACMLLLYVPAYIGKDTLPGY